MKRMQVLLDEAEYRQIQRLARGRGMSLAEWVRQVLRAASRQEPLGDREKKLAAVRAAATHGFPTSDIDRMLEEIARGRDDGAGVILVDSNIPMYLVGAAHEHKTDAQQVLERCIAQGERLVSDAEVLQEILHRYVAIRRPDAIQPAFDALLAVVDEVFPVTQRDAQRAKEIILGAVSISARDAIHLAVMEHNEVDTILSFDRGFDGFPGVTRIG